MSYPEFENEPQISEPEDEVSSSELEDASPSPRPEREVSSATDDMLTLMVINALILRNTALTRDPELSEMFVNTIWYVSEPKDKHGDEVTLHVIVEALDVDPSAPVYRYTVNASYMVHRIEDGVLKFVGRNEVISSTELQSLEHLEDVIDDIIDEYDNMLADTDHVNFEFSAPPGYE